MLVNKQSWITTFNGRFTDLIRASQVPLIQVLEGGLKFQSILFCDRKLVIQFWSILFSISFSSHSSFCTYEICCCRTINHLRDNMKKSVDKSYGISKCTACMVIYVKMTPYLFPFPVFDLWPLIIWHKLVQKIPY